MSHSHTALKLSQIMVSYGAMRAVNGVDLETHSGELVALLGPSGCGKTTLLRVIAGFTRCDSGTVLLGNQDITALPPELRRMGMVFQNYALFPHLSVEANIAYGLKAHGASRDEATRKTREMLEVVRMAGFGARLPRELSGGQQQRVALARALAISPRLLLLDEPLGALDKNLREEMQSELLRIQRELGITTLMVTHDQEEAMSMADRIAVLNKGSIMQLGTPSEIYDAPQNEFVSSFMGSSTVLDGQLTRLAQDRWRMQMPSGVHFEFHCIGPCTRNGPARLALRPEQLELSDVGEAAQVVSARPMGQITRLQVRVRDGTLLHLSAERSAHSDHLAAGTAVQVRVRPQAHCSVFVPPVVAQ
ncbi:ABC transporter ATP-binding protein [Lampropedia puyangensis]|nr:ABC transporter ATP-binding protein [Lampropedia puyangensis]